MYGETLITQSLLDWKCLTLCCRALTVQASCHVFGLLLLGVGGRFALPCIYSCLRSGGLLHGLRVDIHRQLCPALHQPETQQNHWSNEGKDTVEGSWEMQQVCSTWRHTGGGCLWYLYVLVMLNTDFWTRPLMTVILRNYPKSLKWIYCTAGEIVQLHNLTSRWSQWSNISVHLLWLNSLDLGTISWAHLTINTYHFSKRSCILLVRTSAAIWRLSPLLFLVCIVGSSGYCVVGFITSFVAHSHFHAWSFLSLGSGMFFLFSVPLTHLCSVLIYFLMLLHNFSLQRSFFVPCLLVAFSFAYVQLISWLDVSAFGFTTAQFLGSFLALYCLCFILINC